MLNYLKISVCILIMLAASRLIPHPPNFTSLLALGFYIPAILGVKFIPALVISFAITDLVIGFHSTIFFTWGSVIVIGLIAKYFSQNTYYRVFGALFGALIFFIITNFGVWTNGSYGYSFEGLILCYYLALPFFYSSIFSTFVFSGIIEMIYNLNFIRNFLKT
tara:strand:- start:60 stop:548 length:489 start_codon:yes stop_codon:yes gene_type:complete